MICTLDILDKSFLDEEDEKELEIEEKDDRKNSHASSKYDPPSLEDQEVFEFDNECGKLGGRRRKSPSLESVESFINTSIIAADKESMKRFIFDIELEEIIKGDEEKKINSNKEYKSINQDKELDNAEIKPQSIKVNNVINSNEIVRVNKRFITRSHTNPLDRFLLFGDPYFSEKIPENYAEKLRDTIKIRELANKKNLKRKKEIEDRRQLTIQNGSKIVSNSQERDEITEEHDNLPIEVSNSTDSDSSSSSSVFSPSTSLKNRNLDEILNLSLTGKSYAKVFSNKFHSKRIVLKKQSSSKRLFEPKINLKLKPPINPQISYALDYLIDPANKPLDDMLIDPEVEYMNFRLPEIIPSDNTLKAHHEAKMQMLKIIDTEIYIRLHQSCKLRRIEDAKFKILKKIHEEIRNFNSRIDGIEAKQMIAFFEAHPEYPPGVRMTKWVEFKNRNNPSSRQSNLLEPNRASIKTQLAKKALNQFKKFKK